MSWPGWENFTAAQSAPQPKKPAKFRAEHVFVCDDLTLFTRSDLEQLARAQDIVTMQIVFRHPAMADMTPHLVPRHDSFEVDRGRANSSLRRPASVRQLSDRRAMALPIPTLNLTPRFRIVATPADLQFVDVRAVFLGVIPVVRPNGCPIAGDPPRLVRPFNRRLPPERIGTLRAATLRVPRWTALLSEGAPTMTALQDRSRSRGDATAGDRTEPDSPPHAQLAGSVFAHPSSPEGPIRKRTLRSHTSGAI